MRKGRELSRGQLSSVPVEVLETLAAMQHALDYVSGQLSGAPSSDQDADVIQALATLEAVRALKLHAFDLHAACLGWLTEGGVDWSVLDCGN